MDTIVNYGGVWFRTDPDGAGWDLVSSIGPLTSTAWDWGAMATDHGNIEVLFWTNGSFSATTGSDTPEPSSIALGALGVLLIVAGKKRRHTRG